MVQSLLYMIGEIHCHTNLSLPHWAHRNLASPKELVDHALHIGLDFLAITDHDTQAAFPEIQDYALNHGLVLIPSVEITTKVSRISSKRPHILAYGVPDKVHSRQTLPDTIAEIHAQGGIAVAAHPFGVKFSKLTYMGAELIRANDFDGVEVHNSYEDERVNRQAYTIATEKKCLMFAGSDAHSLDHIGLSRIVLDIPRTTAWQDLLQAMKDGKYSIAMMRDIGGGRVRRRMRGSSVSFLFSSLKGKAS